MERLLAAELSWAIRHFEFELLQDKDLLNLQHPLSQLDTFKIHKIFDDLLAYLSQLKDTLHQIQIGKDDIEWFTDSRPSVIKMLDLQNSIYEFVSTILLAPLVLSDGVLTAKLKEVSQVLLDCKLALLTAKKKIDIISNFKEIKGQIINGLFLEVQKCIDMFELSKQWAIPLELPKDISLEQITAKMKLNDITHTGNFSLRSVAFPVFTEQEKEGNVQFETLERRLDPINVAMDFLGQRVRSFNTICDSVFPGAIIELNRDFNRLRKLWEHLLTEFVSLKKHAIDTRWNSLFLFLIEDILQKSLLMITEIQEDHSMGSFFISDELGSTFKTCSNAITLIHKAFLENIVYDKFLAQKYNDTLLPRWTELNALLANDFPTSQPTSPLASTFTEKGYRPIKMAQGRTPLAETQHERPVSTASLGTGIDLGLDVNPSPSVPFSITKTDRIVDLSIDADAVPKNSIQRALLGLMESQGAHEDDDDAATLVHVTPVVSLDDSGLDVWGRLRGPTIRKSRIPLMASNYTRMDYPVIKKTFVEGYNPTKIPSISPFNAVFISPDRRSQSSDSARALVFDTPVGDNHKSYGTRRSSIREGTPELEQTVLKSPPVFNLAQTFKSRRMSSSDSSISGEDIFRSIRSRSSSLRLRAEKMSLVGLTTPNLAFEAGQLSDYSPDRISFRSISSERPES